MTRKSFSRRERGRLFALNHGRCYLCEGRIDVGEAWEIEHEIPWEISRDDSDANLKLAHVKCHRVKTAADRKDISKVQRMAAKNDGSWPKSRARIPNRPFSSSRLWPSHSRTEDHD